MIILKKRTKRKLAIKGRWAVRTAPKLVPALISKSEEPSFCLTRILGNDLWPRHSPRQTIDNLNFFLENEPDFPKTLRHFVLNRIISKERREELEDILSNANAGYQTLEFEEEVYRHIPFDFDVVGGIGFFESSKFADLAEPRQDIARIMTCHKKIRYAMNVNGARNFAIDHGRQISDWTMAWDGACTMTQKGFGALAESCSRFANIRIRVVPMVRMTENMGELPDFADKSIAEEPQLVFNHDTSCYFDERFPYGIRDKTELLTRLAIHGEWSNYRDLPFLPKLLGAPDEQYNYLWVKTAAVRLSSGQKKLDSKSNRIDRASNRSYSILKTIRSLDEKLGTLDDKASKFIYAKDQRL